MPTYQYACTECDHSFEQFQSFTDEALTVCPRCEGRLRKVFNAVGVVFKGSGFYRTDSRKDSTAAGSSNGETKADGGSTSGEGSGSSGSSGSSGTSTADSGTSSNGSGTTSSGSKRSGTQTAGSKGSGTSAA